MEAASSYDGSATTGFMSPARDHVSGPVDLSDAIGLSSPSRYLVKVEGEGLKGQGILPGDLLVVDAAVAAAPGDVVVAFDEGEIVLCTATKRGSGVALVRPGGGLLDQSAEAWAVAVSLVRRSLR